MLKIGEDKYLLDTLQGIIWERKNSPLKNALSLFHLSEGIFFLANETRKKEIDIIVQSNGDPPKFKMFDREAILVDNYFYWFSVSLINYLKLVCLIGTVKENNWLLSDLDNKENKKHYTEQCIKYVNDIVPDIVKWRNKIGAHFAIIDPRRDNLSTLINSVKPIIYKLPFYMASEAQFNYHDTESQNMDIPKWSLTETYTNLTSRFFPTKKILSLQSAFDSIYTQPPQEDLEKINITIQNIHNRTKRKNFKDSDRFFKNGHELYLNKDYKSAILYFKKSLYANNKNISAWSNYSLAYYQLNYPKKSQLILDYTIKYGLTDINTYLCYATLLDYKYNQKEKALAYYKMIPKSEHNFYKDIEFRIEFIENLIEDNSVNSLPPEENGEISYSFIG